LRVEPCRLSAEERTAGVCAQPGIPCGRAELRNRVVFGSSRFAAPAMTMRHFRTTRFWACVGSATFFG
jgi:hypothetical protein